MTWSRPAADEHDAYYSTYIDKVPETDIFALLATQLAETRRVVAGLSADQETFRYAPGKWSVRDLIGHLIDTERVFGFRAATFAHGIGDELPSMDQEEWAAASNAGERPLADLLDELEAVRRSHVLMLRGLPPEAADRRGVASGYEFSVRALAYILAGHEIHHRQVLAERYLPAVTGG